MEKGRTVLSTLCLPYNISMTIHGVRCSACQVKPKIVSFRHLQITSTLYLKRLESEAVYVYNFWSNVPSKFCGG